MNTRQSIFEKIEAIKVEAIRAVKRDCPVGRVVIYRHGNQIRTVEVIQACNERGTLQVRGSRKPYWISGARVLGTQLTFTEKL